MGQTPVCAVPDRLINQIVAEELKGIRPCGISPEEDLLNLMIISVMTHDWGATCHPCIRPPCIDDLAQMTCATSSIHGWCVGPTPTQNRIWMQSTLHDTAALLALAEVPFGIMHCIAGGAAIPRTSTLLLSWVWPSCSLQNCESKQGALGFLRAVPNISAGPCQTSVQAVPLLTA